jgi:hypothetical protein
MQRAQILFTYESRKVGGERCFSKLRIWNSLIRPCSNTHTLILTDLALQVPPTSRAATF